MGNHVLAFVRRDLITAWKHITLSDREGPTFVYGSSNTSVFHAKLKAGDVLWVVSSLLPQGWPPELVARLEVTQQAPKGHPSLEVSSWLQEKFDRKYLAVGDPDASWFYGHNDASAALLNTVFAGPDGPFRPGDGRGPWQSRYGSLLRWPVLIAEGGATALQALADSSSCSVFLSYKWCDHASRPDFIFAFAHALARQGVMTWLDHLALPDSTALDEIVQDAVDLRRLLEYGYKRCKAIVAVGTENYGKQSKDSDENWTLREWEGALAPDHPIKRIVYPLGEVGGQVLDSADHLLRSRDPEDAAHEVRRLLDKPG